MFDDLDKLAQVQKQAKKSEPINNGKKGINLLPGDFRHPEKKKKKAEFKLTKEDFHSAKKISGKNGSDKSPHKPIIKRFPFNKLAGIFKSKKKKDKAPAILSMEIVEDNNKKEPAPKDFNQSSGPSPNNAAQQTKDSNSQHFDKPLIKDDITSKADKANKIGEMKFSQIKENIDSNGIKEEELDVNLLPKRKFRLTSSQIIVSYVMIVLVCLFAVISPYVFFKTGNKKYQTNNITLKNQIESLNERNKELQMQIEELGPLSRKFTQLLPLLDNHTYWSNFFSTLERHTVGSVYFTSLDITQDMLVSLAGRALNLRGIAEQLVVFQNNQSCRNIQIESIAFIEPEEGEQDDPTIDFSLNFELDSKIIHSNSD